MTDDFGLMPAEHHRCRLLKTAVGVGTQLPLSFCPFSSSPPFPFFFLLPFFSSHPLSPPLPGHG